MSDERSFTMSEVRQWLDGSGGGAGGTSQNRRRMGWAEDSKGTVRLPNGRPVYQAIGFDSLNSRGVNIIAERRAELDREKTYSPEALKQERQQALIGQQRAILKLMNDASAAGQLAPDDYHDKLDAIERRLNPVGSEIATPGVGGAEVSTVPGSSTVGTEPGSPKKGSKDIFTLAGPEVSPEQLRAMAPDGSYVRPSTRLPSKSLLDSLDSPDSKATADRLTGVFQTDDSGNMVNVTGKKTLNSSSSLERRRNINYYRRGGTAGVDSLDQMVGETDFLSSYDGNSKYAGTKNPYDFGIVKEGPVTVSKVYGAEERSDAARRSEAARRSGWGWTG